MRVALGAWLMGAGLALGCGATSRNGGFGGGGASAGSSVALGGASEAGSSSVGQGGSAPMAGVCDATVNGVAADPALTSRFRWSECGRISATARPRQALYGGDGSILVLEEGGRLIAYAPDAVSPVVLVPVTSAAEAVEAEDQGLALSSDGETLAAWSSLTAHVYRKPSGGPIDASPGELEPLAAINLRQQGCDGPLRFSPDGQAMVGVGRGNACVWDANSGELTLQVALPEPAAQEPSIAGLAGAAGPLRLFHAGWLWSYDLNGALRTRHEIASANTGATRGTLALSADAGTLMFISREGALVAFDTERGAEAWRQPLQAEAYLGPLVTSNDGHVLSRRGYVYRISDGVEVFEDTPSANGAPAALGPGGSKKLMLDEQVGEWDLASSRLLRLYGGHSEAITSLDVSPDGKFLASHGSRAIAWELAQEFSQSKPLFGGAYSTTRYVALSPQGDAMLVDGDNGAYFRRDGSFDKIADPLPTALCASAGWDFSPDGGLVAGNWYGSLFVRHGRSFAQVKALGKPQQNCGTRVAFSPDGTHLMTSELELIQIALWRTLRRQAFPSSSINSGVNSVAYSPDCQEVVRTECTGRACRSARHDAKTGELLGATADLTGERAYYSPEGHFVLSNERVHHIPSAVTSPFALQASSAIFTVDGAIIAGEADGSLVRYCRASD